MDEIEARGLMLQAETEGWECLKPFPKLLFLYQLRHMDRVKEIAEFAKEKQLKQEKANMALFDGSDNPSGPLPF